MDSPIENAIGLAFLHNTDRQDDLPTTPPLSPLHNNINSTITTTTPRPSVIHHTSSYTTRSSRTPSPSNVTLSTSTTRQQSTDNITHQHQQQEITPTDIHNQSPTPECNTNNARHTGTKYKRTSNVLRNAKHFKSDDSTTRDETKQRTSATTTNVQSQHHRSTSRDTSPTPSTSTSRNIIREDDYDDSGCTYTFILHKQTLNNIPSPTKKAPTFAAFDHGDHFHFIFSVKHTNNASRQLSTILGYLQVSIAGTTEAHTTLQLVRYSKRFLSYLRHVSASHGHHQL
jgi:hypothetical protein